MIFEGCAVENLVVNNKEYRVFMCPNYRPDSCPLEIRCPKNYNVAYLFKEHQISMGQLSTDTSSTGYPGL